MHPIGPRRGAKLDGSGQETESRAGLAERHLPESVEVAGSDSNEKSTEKDGVELVDENQGRRYPLRIQGTPENFQKKNMLS